MVRKREKLEVKDHRVRVTEQDYRGVLSLILTLGLVALLLKGDLETIAVIGPLTGTAIGWYFSHKKR